MMMVEKRRVSDFIDIQKVSFPFTFMITIVSIFVSSALGIYTGQYGLKSEMAGIRADIRVLITQIEARRDTDKILMDIMRRDIDEWGKEVKMLKAQRDDIQKQIFDLRTSNRK